MGKILILEDDYELAATWREALLRSGHEVEIGLTSNEALAHLSYQDFDLFIIDLFISNPSDGLRDSGRVFLRLMQNSAGAKSKPTIGVTGFKPIGNEDAARSNFKIYGVIDVLFKPIDPAVLVSQVEAALAAHRAETQEQDHGHSEEDARKSG